MSLPIEDYALIGDCESAALVGRDGSIDWLCLPRFDSDACFAALLGTPEHGRWRIAPEAEGAKASRAYRGDTLILETRFETEGGAVTVIDFMPPRDESIEVVRLVVGERGRVAMRTDLTVRFGYGNTVPWVTQPEPETLRAVAGPDKVVLRTPVPLHGEDMATVGRFEVGEGERVAFVLSYTASHKPDPAAIDPEAGLASTEAFWTEWSATARKTGGWNENWSEAVMRSLITLKALIYGPTGAIVAAPTTSLPETPGGIRNWDYRYCWLRDATLTLLALMNGGYYEEAQAWRDWLLRSVAGTPAQAQIMYGIAGERRLNETELSWLPGYAVPGYEGAKPVRIGNGAHDQLQLDVTGEVIDALYQGLRGGMPASPESWSIQRGLLNEMETSWSRPDRGIWESRGEPRHYTYSKVMAWVAFDRGIKMAEEFGLEGPVERWRALRDEVHADVCAKGFDTELDSFVQAYGSKNLDASLLLIPMTGFLPPDDPRIAGTIKAIEGRMIVGGFVMRHDPTEVETGLKRGEGAFLACSFWLADAYVLTGRDEEARALLDRLLAIRNDVGLLAEEYEPGIRRQLGNFPQAFSHIALVNTVHNLSQRDKPAEQRSQQEKMQEPA